MNENRVENLLEQLVEINKVILTELSEMRADVAEIKNEMSWVDDHSFASTLINRIGEASSDIATELDWAKDLSFAKTVVDGIDNITMSLANIEANTSGL
tara:strand:- start:2222 stop:2518 length:297 start_codon:yes stop_codon:yes gene_type:complete